MHRLALFVFIKIIALSLLFLSMGLTFENTSNHTSQYTEVLHFQYDDSPDGYLEDEEAIDFMNSHPKWLYSELPNDLNPDLAGELFQLGYKRSKVRKRDFAELDSIFVCKPLKSHSTLSCATVYRDILIFRKRKEVIKILQLCFNCKKSHFIGPWVDVKSFGQKGEFTKLKTLLNK